MFDPARHESLTHVPWNDGKARDMIGWIARETERAFTPTSWWPMHPKDGEDGRGPRNRAALRRPAEHPSYLIGDTGIELVRHALAPTPRIEARLHELIASNLDHPARELMWGSPGTMLAASFLHERTGAASWADLYRASARRLQSQLHWSDEYQCHYWRQDLHGDATYRTGDPGFAIYLWDCINAKADFPTLDVFYAQAGER